MKQIIILITFASLIFNLRAQNNVSNFDTVIIIREVSVFAKKGLSVLQSDNRESSIHVRGKGKTSLVTRVDVDKNFKYETKALEFFFNYQWQGFEGEGFYIRPLIFTSGNETPNYECLNNQSLYFVSKEIDEVIHIDISNYNFQIENSSSFFVGIEFVDADGKSKYEDFNVTMFPVKNGLNTSFIKGSCAECTFSPFNLDKKNGLSLKYNILYK